MTVLPTFVRTGEDFEAAVRLGESTESLVLEFKSSLGNWNPPKGTPQRETLKRVAQKELCRDIAQFANTLGGCLIVGVSERVDENGVPVADAIVPVADSMSMRQWIEDAIVNYLTPSTFSRDIQAVPADGGDVLAINVPPSRALVAIWDRREHTVEFLRRTSHGKEWMNPDEAERHRMSHDRIGRLAVLEATKAATSDEVVICGGFRVRPINSNDRPWNPSGPVVIGHIDERIFELRVPKGSSVESQHLPFTVVRDAWVGADGRVNLLLSVRLVWWGGTLVVEPSF